MNANTILNIYQSYSLAKVSALNQQSLAAIYAQNGQLEKLNYELARANRTTAQILRNQIKEIEQQEKRRFYKNMTFNLSQAMSMLEDEENPNFRMFASSLFLAPIRDMAKEVVLQLEEIADKEYAQNIVKRANALENNCATIYQDYQQTAWAKLLAVKSQLADVVKSNQKETTTLNDKIRNAKKVYEEFEKKHKKDIKKIEKDIDNNSPESNKNGCVGCTSVLIILTLLITFGAYSSNDYTGARNGVIAIFVICLIFAFCYYFGENKGWVFDDDAKKVKVLEQKLEHNEKECEERKRILRADIEMLSDEISELQKNKTRLTTQYNEILQEITVDYPKWEERLSEIAELIPHEENKNTSGSKTSGSKDPLLEEAARVIVSTQQGSTSLIQRKFSIGYNRANKILNQLEELGVVGQAKGTEPRELLIKDIDALKATLAQR